MYDYRPPFLLLTCSVISFSQSMFASWNTLATLSDNSEDPIGLTFSAMYLTQCDHKLEENNNRVKLCLCMVLTLLIILLATDSSSQQSSRYQLYTSAAVSRYLLSKFVKNYTSYLGRV